MTFVEIPESYRADPIGHYAAVKARLAGDGSGCIVDRGIALRSPAPAALPFAIVLPKPEPPVPVVEREPTESEARRARAASVAARLLYEGQQHVVKRGKPAPYAAISTIKAVVCEEFKIPAFTFSAPRRECGFVRQVAYWLGRNLTAASYPKLGKSFGGLDHSSILHGCRKIDERRDADPEFRSRLDALCDKVRVMAGLEPVQVTEG